MEEEKDYFKTYYEKNKEVMDERSKEWKRKNKEAWNLYQRDYKRKKYKESREKRDLSI